MAAAVTPVPQDQVSASTPRSKVLTADLVCSRHPGSTKLTFTPPSPNLSGAWSLAPSNLHINLTQDSLRMQQNGENLYWAGTRLQAVLFLQHPQVSGSSHHWEGWSAMQSVDAFKGCVQCLLNPDAGQRQWCSVPRFRTWYLPCHLHWSSAW